VVAGEGSSRSSALLRCGKCWRVDERVGSGYRQGWKDRRLDEVTWRYLKSGVGTRVGRSIRCWMEEREEGREKREKGKKWKCSEKRLRNRYKYTKGCRPACRASWSTGLAADGSGSAEEQPLEVSCFLLVVGVWAERADCRGEQEKYS
jgi:hypothetical protein